MAQDEGWVFPQQLYVYACDFDGANVPIFAVGESLNDVELGDVAVYELKSEGQVIETRKFKQEKK